MRRGESPILPMNKVNIKTGKNHLFNVFETWRGDDTIVEIWRPTNGKNVRIVFGSGQTSTSEIGSHRRFIHDQNHRFLFNGFLVDFCLLKDLPEKASQYGNPIIGYVYK
jgi:hypothetical protein